MHNPPLILIADDEPDSREILAAKLKQEGYWVAEAKDGQEAVEKALALKPDLIVMDINMPNENGTEAVLDIRENSETKNTKIVFLSNLKNPWPGLKDSHPVAAKELGASDFIDKGGDLNQAVATIKKLLG